MSAKKKNSKGLAHQTGGTSEGESAALEGLTNCTLTALSNLSFYGRVKDAAFRPVHSRIVNLNSLRPHGALQEGGVNTRMNSTEPPSSLLEDIVSMVNDSQKLLRRTPDFTLEVLPKDTVVDGLNVTAFHHWWLDTLAKECKSAVEFPFTEFRFMSPFRENVFSTSSFSSDSNISKDTKILTCMQTAETIQRILRVFANASNNTEWKFEQLLFHILRTEERSVEGLVSVNYNSRHITVCCGLYFYRVDVLDDNGFVVDVSIIAERLKAILEHSHRTECVLREKKLLPEALEDLIAFHKLIGRLTEIDREEYVAVYERLKGADPCNASSLADIDRGIFTVILRSLDGQPASARWYRSALVLEEKDAANDTLLLAIRGHSSLIHGEYLMEFVMRVLSWENASIDSIKICNESLNAAKLSAGGASTAAGGSEEEENKLPLGVKHLDLWLPWKHRKPMHPYPICKPSSHVFPLSLPPGHSVSFACLCMSAVFAVQQVLTSCTEFPTVLVAFPKPKGGGISAALMYSYEIEEFIRSLRSGSALIEQRTKKHMALKALESLSGIIDACFHEPFPTYSMAKLLLSKGKAAAVDACRDNAFLGTVDLHVTVGMLRRGPKALEYDTNFLLPSRFSLICSASGDILQGSSAENPSLTNLLSASLKVSGENTDTSIGSQLTSCVMENLMELLSLLTNVNHLM